jgi:uncharacterized protein YkwD
MSQNLGKIIAGLAILVGTHQLIDRDHQNWAIALKQPPLELAQFATENTKLELEIHQQINQYRQSRNLPPLKLDSRITQQARLHSQRMAAKSASFSHDGFEQRYKAIAREIPLRGAAENIAYNQGYSDPVSIVVKGWINSAGHHENMIGNYDLTGIGVASNSQGEYYFTQIFVLKRSQ